MFIKYLTTDIRQKKLTQFRRSRNISLLIPLPAKEITMRVTDTKQHLIEIGRNDLKKHIPAKSNKHIITAQADVSKQVQSGVRIRRDDLKST